MVGLGFPWGSETQEPRKPGAWLCLQEEAFLEGNSLDVYSPISLHRALQKGLPAVQGRAGVGHSSKHQ